MIQTITCWIVSLLVDSSKNGCMQIRKEKDDRQTWRKARFCFMIKSFCLNQVLYKTSDKMYGKLSDRTNRHVKPPDCRGNAIYFSQ